MRRSATTLFFAAALALCLAPGRARAQSASKQATAQALFEDAKKLMGKNDFAAACQKFADSQQLDPAPGTEFNLANCYEKNGQTASAWATFKSAAASYRAHNRSEWEQKARERAAALESKLAKLTLVLPTENNVTGIEIKRDGVVVSTSEIGAAIPVDPGDHVIEAAAPGKKAWRTTAKVSAASEQKITVGPLEAERAAVSPPAAAAKPKTDFHDDKILPAPVASPSSSQKTIGFVVLGVGVVGLAVGGVSGLLAISKNNTASQACPSGGACASQDAVDASNSAKSLATVSTIGFIAGGAGVAAGALLVLTAPSSKSPPAVGVRVVPTAGPSGAGLLATGAF